MTDTKREIKFRAWDYKNEEMIVWEKLVENHTELIDLNINPERFTFMQFTGLFDKNDKEIYEGDLVKHFDGGQISLVEWSSGDWGWHMESVKNWNPKTGFDYSLDEIIGNIYENPELTKKD